MFYRGLSYLALSWCLVGQALSQSSEPEFVRLSNAPVDVGPIASDSLGFTWMGTGYGLFRYEGATLTRFTHDPENPNSLTNDAIGSLAVGPDGALWIGTLRGLNRLDPATERITRYEHVPGDPESLPNSRIISIYVEGETAVWIGMYDGAARLDLATGRLRRYRYDANDPATLSGPTVSSITRDGLGRMWFGGWFGAGLTMLDTADTTFVRYPILRSFYDPGVIDFVNQRMNDRVAGLLQVPSEEDRTTTFDSAEDADYLVVASYESLEEDVDDVGWIEDAQGRMIWNVTSANCAHGGGAIRNWLCIELLSLPAGRYTVRYTTDPVHAFDAWEGVAPIHPDWWGIMVLPVKSSEKETLGPSLEKRIVDPRTVDGNVLDLSIRRDTLWIGTSESLATLDLNTELIERHKLRDAAGRRHGVDVWGLVDDGDAKWVVMDSSDVVSHIGRIYSAKGPFVESMEISGAYLRNLNVDPNANVWLGSNGQGVYVRPGQSDIFSLTHRGKSVTGLGLTPSGDVIVAGDGDCPVLPESLAENCTAFLYSDRGLEWIGTHDGAFRVGPGGLEHFPNDPLNPGSLRGDDVADIIRARDGSVWIATNDINWDGGVNRYDGNGFDVFRYNPNDAGGLTGPNQVDLLEDSRGRLWVANNGGIDEVIDNGREFINYSKGLREPPMAIVEDESGRLWVGDFRGNIYTFDPDKGMFILVRDGGLQAWSHFAAMEIDRVGGLWASFDGFGVVRIDTGSGIQRAYTLENGLPMNRFSPRVSLVGDDGNVLFGTPDGVLAIDAASLSVLTPGKPLLTDLRIDNASVSRTRDWTIPPDAMDFSVRLVSPDYFRPVRLEYRLVGYDDVWTEVEPGAEIEFRRMPAGRYMLEGRKVVDSGTQWLLADPIAVRVTQHFWLAEWFRWLIALAALSLVAAALHWRQRQLQSIEDLRRRVAADLHDDVGSQLASLRLMADMAAHEDVPPDVRRADLERIAVLSGDLIDAIGEIAWFIQPRERQADQLMDQMKMFAERHAGNATVRFACDNPAILDLLSLEKRRDFMLIFKEAVRNAARHSGAAEIRVLLTGDSGHLELAVQDNGRGLPEDSNGNGHGRENMKLRARRIGADLVFESENGNGTTVRLRLPLDV